MQPQFICPCGYAIMHFNDINDLSTSSAEPQAPVFARLADFNGPPS